MKGGTSLGNGAVNSKYAARECRQDMAIHSGTQNVALFSVAPL